MPNPTINIQPRLYMKTIILKDTNSRLLLCLLASFFTLSLTGCRGLYMPDYDRQSATHQDVEMASSFKLGVTMEEVRKKMGRKPVRIDTEGDTVVWQYCNTERNRSHYAALFFSAKSNSLKKKNNYTIFWDETKDMVVEHGDVVVRPSTFQMSCEYVAQKMGVKDPNNIEIWFTAEDAQRYRNMQRYDQLQAQQSQQTGGYDNSQDARRQEEQRMRQREQYNRVNGLR